ncbi:MAG: hmp 3 [Conexibacter sp.]|nr:hmp 3 [Conexibacter sp.]
MADVTGVVEPRREALGRELEGRRGILGALVVVATVVVALLLYLLEAKGIGGRPIDFKVGEALGIAAAVLLADAGILAVRLAPLEWLFGDMTKVYRAHAIVGLTMFGLVTVHPLLYVLGALPRTRPATHIIVPFHLVQLDWISWILILVALAPTLWVRISFDRWRITHIALGCAVVLTGVSLLITSTTFDTIQITALRVYLIVLFAVATASILYVVVLRRLIEPKHEYRLAAAVAHPESGAVELTLSAVKRPLRFTAGQYTYVDLIDDRLQVKREYRAHPYSISSAPRGSDLSVIVEATGRSTEQIQQLVASEHGHALLHGAYGRLDYARAHSRKQLWIAGGVGVTPFLSMAEQLADRADAEGHYEITFVIAVAARERAFFLERLESYAARHAGLTVELWPTDERGHVTAEAIAELVPDVAERVVLISGPHAMIAELEHGLRRHGVHHDRMRSEVPVGPPKSWRHASRTVQVLRWVVTAEVVVFVAAALASTIGRAVT